MNPLSPRQAANCEQAREPVCRCRCGGTLHGAKRGDGTAFFEALPEDDPHYILSAEVKERHRRDAAERKKREREDLAERRYRAMRQVMSMEAGE